MRRLKLHALMLLAAFVVFGCSKEYDDTELKNSVSDLKSRVEKLETWCTAVNGQISALQGLVTALEANDYVTGISPLANDEGYTITFSKSGAITIKNGKDGADGVDGTTPVIGVDKDADGLYYWTVKIGDAAATWMLDANGKQIRTTGDKGANGIDGHSPVLSVETFTDGKVYWKVDGTWLLNGGNKVQATGDKGATGATGSAGVAGPAGTNGDSVFKKDGVDVKSDPNTVTFTLADGKTTFTLPRTSDVKIFDAFTTYRVNGNKTELTLALNVKKGSYAALKAELTTSKGMSVAIVKATRSATEPWGVALAEPTFKADGTIDVNGKVIFTFPAGTSEGDIALLKVTVIDDKGSEHASTRVMEYSTKVDVESISLNKQTTAINVGESETLTATAAPTGASSEVTWSSSNEDVATVDAMGKVTGKAKGDAVITATSTENTTFTAICAVTVNTVALEKIELTDKKVTKDATLKLVPTFTPDNATNKEMAWKSDNETIATVAADGTVTGKAKGDATITATSKENGGIIATCKVTVIEGYAEGGLYPNATNPIGLVFWVNPDDATKGMIVSLTEFSGTLNFRLGPIDSWAESLDKGGKTWRIPTVVELRYLYCAYIGVPALDYPYNNIPVEVDGAKSQFNNALIAANGTAFSENKYCSKDEVMGAGERAYLAIDFSDGRTPSITCNGRDACKARVIADF